MFFPPCFRAECEITIWGPASPGGLARGPDRALHLGARSRRSRSASCRARSPSATPRRPSGSSAGRRSAPRRSPTAARRSATGSPTATTTLCLHPRPRAGARRAARRARAGVDLGLRPRPRRRPADPRLPVHRRRVPRAHRLGPLGALRHAHLRRPGRGPAAAALPPRPAALRRVPRRAPRDRPPRAGRSSAATPALVEHGHGGRRARGRPGAPSRVAASRAPTAGRLTRARAAAGPPGPRLRRRRVLDRRYKRARRRSFRHRDKETSSAPRA